MMISVNRSRSHVDVTRRGQPHWPLLAFGAATWLFFANDLAMLGTDLSTGGIGGDAHHAAALVGTAAMLLLIASMFHVRFTTFSAALTGGLSLATAMSFSGFRDLVASGIWHVECSGGSGAACANLAETDDGARSWVSSAAEIRAFYGRAGWHRFNLAPSRVAVPRTTAARDETESPAAAHCHLGARSGCELVAAQLEQRGDLLAAYHWHEAACELAETVGDTSSCDTLLNSGFPNHREAGCATFERICGAHDAACAVRLARCDRYRSPDAGSRSH